MLPKRDSQGGPRFSVPTHPHVSWASLGGGAGLGAAGGSEERRQPVLRQLPTGGLRHSLRSQKTDLETEKPALCIIHS